MGIWIPCGLNDGSGGTDPEIVTWASGTDEQIVAMLEAHYAGQIDIHDYWTVGDTRTISLSAMSASSPLTDTHVAQDVTFVLSHAGGKYLADGVTECCFQVDQLNPLSEQGVMNKTNTNTTGWKSCPRRTWCNSNYYNAIPSTLRPIFKQYINQSGIGNTGTNSVENTTDYFALRAEIEVTGSRSYSATGEGSQVNWYKTQSNRIKKVSNSGMNWYLRSPRLSNAQAFCWIKTNGGSYFSNANVNAYLAPFGVI